MSQSNSPDLTPVVPRRHRAVFFMLVACFAFWGLLNNMTDNLVPSFQRIFTVSQSEAGLIQVAFYGAYAVLAILASILIEEFSYRVGLLISLGIYILGALCYIPACSMQSLELYFIAIFVVAGGCSLMETTCNPYVLSLGPDKTAVRRLNFAQAFNPVGSLMGILLAQQLILANLNSAGAEERAAMGEEQLREIVHHELFWVCVPYVGLCVIASVLWVLFLRAKEEPAAATAPEAEAPKRGGGMRALVATIFSIAPLVGFYFLMKECSAEIMAALDATGFLGDWLRAVLTLLPKEVIWVLCGLIGPFAYLLVMPTYRSMFAKLLRLPRYWCGVIAQFFYVGVQIAAWTWLNAYCQKELGVTPKQGATYYLIALILFIGCRWVATYYMKKFNPGSMMALFATAAIACCAGVIYLPSTVLFSVGGLPITPNAICLVSMSGCMSLMFPTIYGIALGGLGKEVKLGAAGLIMAILGGAIITPWMASWIGSGTLNAIVPMYDTVVDSTLMTSSAAIRSAFAVPALCFAVVLAYALIFRNAHKAR